ncbi:hypothetical protein ACIQU4_41890 [Streptomyces sp. NPDC090741]|uniref:hypothetical protein n=1 Tax=Streptomyces sp. NPDC090741 TaxID=3365967 RepID=UPI0037F970D1
MATFQLLGLKCWETTDGFGADQVRIIFGFDDLMFFDNDMGEGTFRDPPGNRACCRIAAAPGRP